MHQTTMSFQQPISMVVIMQNTQGKAILHKMKVNAMKTRKVHVDKNEFYTGKERRPCC